MNAAETPARSIAFGALGMALLVICAWISIPTTIPFTMQTFAVCLTAALFGARLGCWTVAGYILLGAAGLPVFAGFRGGPGVLLGPTGGYILGFLLTALTVGLAAPRSGRRTVPLLVSMAAGVLLCYAFGTLWFLYGYAGSGGPVSLLTALSWCVFPYLLPDACKIALAAMLAVRLRPLLRRPPD